jgi:hypothetical protein
VGLWNKLICQDMLVSGIHPPLGREPLSGASASSSAETENTLSLTAASALETWRKLLDEGGANVKTTKHVDAVRYSKVSYTSPANR